MKFCVDCKWFRHHGLYKDSECMRNVVEEQPEYDIIYGNKISRFSGKPLDPNVERRLTCKIHNYPDDRCGKKGKYWKAKDGWS